MTLCHSVDFHPPFHSDSFVSQTDFDLFRSTVASRSQQTFIKNELSHLNKQIGEFQSQKADLTYVKREVFLLKRVFKFYLHSGD